MHRSINSPTNPRESNRIESSTDAYTALEPYISARTLQFHHDKHHAKYVANTVEMIKGTDLETASLDEIIKASKGACVDPWGRPKEGVGAVGLWDACS